MYVTPFAYPTSTKHRRDVGFINGDSHVNWKAHFGVYGHPRNKNVQALLRPKADNILPGLGWVMIYGIRAAAHVFLSDDGANLSKDAESLRGCM